MNEELTAKEALQITARICEENTCNTCPLASFRGKGNSCRDGIAEHTDEVIEICKRWKANHISFETEWVHICRIIKDTGYKKECAYEKEIDEDEILPFSTYDGIAENVLEEYCKSHKGKFFCDGGADMQKGGEVNVHKSILGWRSGYNLI